MAWEMREQGKGEAQKTTGEGKPFVAVCLCHTGSFSAEFVERTYTLLKAVPHPAFDKVILLSRGTPLDVCRNMLCQNFLNDSRFTHLFFIDSDIVFEEPSNPNEAINQLLSCDVPIVSGLYRARKKEGFFYAAWIKNQNCDDKLAFTAITEWTGNFIRVDVCGAGCLLIRREVLEKLPLPFFEWDNITGIPSEDFYFNLKAKEHGFDTFVFTDVHCSHISGQLKIKCDGSVTTTEV